MNRQNQKQIRRTRQAQVGQDDQMNRQVGVPDSSARQQSAAAPAQQSRPGEDIESGRTQTEDAFDVDNRGQR